MLNSEVMPKTFACPEHLLHFSLRISCRTWAATFAGWCLCTACGMFIMEKAQANGIIGDETNAVESKHMPPAEDIRSAILADIDDAQSLSVADIDVSYRNGLATIYGLVDSLMDRRRAAEVAKRTRYVTAVLNQIIVRKSKRSDSSIREDVVMRLRVNDSLERKEIAIDVTDGRVAIAGSVDSLAEKRLAEIAAAGVRGVMAVDNQLVVEPASNRSDLELREEIQGLIVNSVYLDNVDIDVRVRDGIAYLSGAVGSAAQQEDLRRVAEIWGVVSVDDDGVSIDSTLSDPTERAKRFAKVSDSSIEKAVGQVFFNDPIVFTAVDSISAMAEEGVVTLRGLVNRLQTKHRAERLAMDVIGVVRINNEIKVEYRGETPPDANLIRLVQQALQRSPYLDRREFRVHCQRAHVSLFGLVDSQLEKELAGWLSSGIPGVVHVNNALAIETDWVPKSDEQIEQDLLRKLQFVLFEASDDIEVKVSDGVALLTGSVDTWRQWQAAIDLAVEAGAKHPHNMLNVRYHPPHGASRIYVPR